MYFLLFYLSEICESLRLRAKSSSDLSVVLCHVKPEQLIFTAQWCDLNPSNNALIVPSVSLGCSNRLAPLTVVDALMGRQTALLDPTTPATFRTSLTSIKPEISLSLSFGSCTERKRLFSSVASDDDYLMAVVLNHEAEQAALLLDPSATTVSYRAGSYLFPVRFFFQSSAAKTLFSKLADCDAGPTDCGAEEQNGLVPLYGGAEARIADLHLSN
jgi:hypothetical protein